MIDLDELMRQEREHALRELLERCGLQRVLRPGGLVSWTRADGAELSEWDLITRPERDALEWWAMALFRIPRMNVISALDADEGEG